MLASWPLLELAGAVGLTVVLTMARISSPLRRWVCLAWALVSRDKCPAYCSQCVGFWVGLGVGVCAFAPSVDLASRYVVSCSLLFAFTTSIVSLVVSTWLRAHGEYSEPPD